MSVEDKNSAIETVSREKATNDPGSVGTTMSGVVVEVRVKEGQEIKKGDPLCGKTLRSSNDFCIDAYRTPMISSERDEGEHILYPDGPGLTVEIRWNPLLLLQYLDISKECLFNQVCHSTLCVRMVFYRVLGDSLNQGDLVVEIVH